MKYWLIKSEPSAWSWQDQKKEKTTMWDGVRNYQARNFMKSMKIGDLAFFYHSIKEKKIVGVVKVTKEHYPDPTDKSNKFVVVDVDYYKEIKEPVSLAQLKENDFFKDLPLIKQSRLSVMPIEEKYWEAILELSKTII